MQTHIQVHNIYDYTYTFKRLMHSKHMMHVSCVHNTSIYTCTYIIIIILYCLNLSQPSLSQPSKFLIWNVAHQQHLHWQSIAYGMPRVSSLLRIVYWARFLCLPLTGTHIIFLCRVWQMKDHTLPHRWAYADPPHCEEHVRHSNYGTYKGCNNHQYHIVPSPFYYSYGHCNM